MLAVLCNISSIIIFQLLLLYYFTVLLFNYERITETYSNSIVLLMQARMITISIVYYNI